MNELSRTYKVFRSDTGDVGDGGLRGEGTVLMMRKVESLSAANSRRSFAKLAFRKDRPDGSTPEQYDPDIVV